MSPSVPLMRVGIYSFTMFDFAKARKSMVDSQIRTASVVDGGVLAAFEDVPREIFVPLNLKPMAYCDDALPLVRGRFLLPPMVHAKMMQAAMPRSHEIVLDVGCANGYGSAVFARLASTVIALEQDKTLSAQVEKLCETTGACNVVSVTGPLEQGYAKHGPYDVIFVNGACAEVPQTLVDQLSPEGRLLLVLKPAGSKAASACIVHKQAGSGKGSFSSYALFDALVPYLSGFEPKAEFVFS